MIGKKKNTQMANGQCRYQICRSLPSPKLRSNQILSPWHEFDGQDNVKLLSHRHPLPFKFKQLHNVIPSGLTYLNIVGGESLNCFFFPIFFKKLVQVCGTAGSKSATAVTELVRSLFFRHCIGNEKFENNKW